MRKDQGKRVEKAIKMKKKRKGGETKETSGGGGKRAK